MARGPLGQRAFRLLFLGQAVSALGDRVVPVALAFAVLDLTGSVSDLGIVLAAQTAPLALFALLGGVWADRLPRQLVMLASDGVRAGAQGASAALLLSGSAHIWQLAVLQAVYGAAEAFFGPAALGLVAQTVQDEDLQQANALLGLTINATSIAGPALAGVVVTTLGPGWGLAVDGASFIVSGVFLSLIRLSGATRGEERASRQGTVSELRAGWRAFRSRTWLWVGVVYFSLFLGFGYSAQQVLGPKVALQALGGAGAWAAISVVIGIGAVAGGILALRWEPRYPLRIGFGSALVAGPAFFALLAAHAPLGWIAGAALVDGVSATLFVALWHTTVQREVPENEISRVTSWDYLGSYALQPLGLATVGPIGAAVGISSTLYGAGALFLILTIAILAFPSVRNYRAEIRQGTACGPCAGRVD